MSFTDVMASGSLDGVMDRISEIQSGPPALPSGAGTAFESVMQQVGTTTAGDDASGAAGAQMAQDSSTPVAPAASSAAGSVDLSGSFGWPLEEGQVLSPSELDALGPAGAAGGPASGTSAAPVNGYVLDTGSGATASSGSLQDNLAGSQAASTSSEPGLANVASSAGAVPAPGSSIVPDAQKYLGVPYLWGGTDPTVGLDCSGLVQRVFNDLGVSVPRTADEQSQIGTPVNSLSQAEPGDLVFFAGSDGTASDPGHVGIYVGNGQMIDAPHTGTVVRQEPVTDAGPVVAIRRVLSSSSAVNSAEGADGATSTNAISTDDGSGGSNMAVETSGAAPTASSYDAAFNTATAAQSLPANLLKAVAQTESGMNPSAVSSAGAEGLMQLMPSTAASLGVDPFDPTQAINGAASLLSSLHQKFGSWPLAVAAYNAGPGAVEEYGGIPPYPQTQSYVQKVLTSAGMEA